MFALVVGLTACSNWQGDMAEIVISFESAGRTILYNAGDTATHQKLEHQIILTSAAEKLEFIVKSGAVFEAMVTPGKWNITVNSWLDGEIYATGSKDVILKLGRNNETIEMYQAIYWWTWNASTAGGQDFDSATESTITSSDYSSCNVTVSGSAANSPDNNWASQVGCSYTATAGKTYKATWKWKADNKPFQNVTIRYAQNKERDGTTDYLYEFNTNINKLTIPVTEETKTYQFIIPDNYDTNFTFMVGADTGSFRIWDVRIEEVKIVDVPGKTLADKLNWLQNNAVDNGNYLVTVNGNESISGNWLSYGKDNNHRVTITLTGGGTVTLSSPGCMFDIGSNVTLILENITLKGIGNNDSSLVGVHGKLIMNDKSVITGNSTIEGPCGIVVHDGGYLLLDGGTISNNTTTQNGCGGVNMSYGIIEMRSGTISGNKGDNGGGVWVDNGTFTMTGGTISGNTSNWGGGVSVWEGTFIMNGGEISGNTAQYGGGVNVDNRGIFTMNGGEIYSNTATNGGGGGVKVINNGTFNMNGGEITGNTAQWGGGIEVWQGILNKAAKADGGKISKNTSTTGDTNNAVHANNEANNFIKKRDSNVPSDVALYYNAIDRTSSGGWDTL